MVSTTDEVINEAVAVDSQLPTEIKTISEEEFEKAQKTYQLGKKNLFLSKYDESVSNIGDACKIYSAKFGEMDPQCAEVYFFYGRALLELARVENTVLGNALTGVPEDTSPINDSRYGNPEDVAADEKKEISDKVIDALCEVNDEPENKVNDVVPTKDEKTEDKPVSDETKVTTTDAAEEVKTTETKEAGNETVEDENVEEEGEEEGEDDGEDISKADEAAKDDAENEEISSLQRAWEMFELAKLIYSKNYDNDLVFKHKRIAECLLKLGEISIEQEVYDQAINDVKESIKIQEEEPMENRDERMLAESFYQLGLAQQFNNQFNDANDSYQKSINIVQLRIEKLKGKLESINQENDDLEKNTIKDEIAELEILLPEMSAKLEEVNEQGQQSLSLIKEAKECFLNNIETTCAAATPAANGEVKDITSLVKSKRKIENLTDESNTNGKKTRLSEEHEINEEKMEDVPTSTTSV